jgi:hypothetical protein
MKQKCKKQKLLLKNEDVTGVKKKKRFSFEKRFKRFEFLNHFSTRKEKK